jgi:hypothetical protein
VVTAAKPDLLACASRPSRPWLRPLVSDPSAHALADVRSASQARVPSDALTPTRTGNLSSWSAGTATIAQIRSQIRSGRPLGARIGWSGGGGHFVMIAGYRACDPDEYVDVRDPIYGSSDISLATFTNSYQSTGSWTHTYYTEP